MTKLREFVRRRASEVDAFLIQECRPKILEDLFSSLGFAVLNSDNCAIAYRKSVLSPVGFSSILTLPSGLPSVLGLKQLFDLKVLGSAASVKVCLASLYLPTTRQAAQMAWFLKVTSGFFPLAERRNFILGCDLKASQRQHAITLQQCFPPTTWTDVAGHLGSTCLTPGGIRFQVGLLFRERQPLFLPEAGGRTLGLGVLAALGPVAKVLLQLL